MRAFTAVAVTLLLAATALAQTARTFINPRSEALNKNETPFSGAVRVGDTLYLSGQLGLGPDRKPPSEVSAEAKLVMEGRFERVPGGTPGIPRFAVEIKNIPGEIGLGQIRVPAEVQARIPIQKTMGVG